MYVIDESSYRIDKTSFPSAEEAEQRAGEAARIVNRAISVYEMLEGELHFAFRVMPCGKVETDQPTVDPDSGDQIVQEYPVLGAVVAELDLITEELEAKGAVQLAARVDRVVGKLTADRVSPGVKMLVASLGKIKQTVKAASQPYDGKIYKTLKKWLRETDALGRFLYTLAKISDDNADDIEARIAKEEEGSKWAERAKGSVANYRSLADKLRKVADYANSKHMGLPG